MGLGKTIQAIGMANAIEADKILVICPASLKINWSKEMQKWLMRTLSVAIVWGKKDEDAFGDEVVIINYELLNAHASRLRDRRWDLIIIDEAHYLKSNKADRTGQVFGRKRGTPARPKLAPIPFEHILLLTGTPMLNGKPKELWPLLQVLDPDGLGSDWFAFARRYCDLFEIEQFDAAKGEKVHVGWKWDGAKNLDELQLLMRERFMIRRLKKDVLKELPPKTRQIIVLEAKKGLTKLLEHERISYEEYVKTHGEEIDPPAFTEMSKIRKEVALAKVPYVIEYLKEVLDETEKVVVWVHHHETFDAIQTAFGSAAIGVDGRTDSVLRQQIVDLFQTDASKHIFIGGIKAAGTGLTLTAASVAVFAELDWVPANVTQAEDRLHRIGQEENVLVRHVVLNGSLDQRIVQAIIRKQEIADRTLDKEAQ
jgi:SNF2 family DNA or RNA helicase